MDSIILNMRFSSTVSNYFFLTVFIRIKLFFHLIGANSYRRIVENFLQLFKKNPNFFFFYFCKFHWSLIYVKEYTSYFAFLCSGVAISNIYIVCYKIYIIFASRNSIFQGLIYPWLSEKKLTNANLE